MAKEKCDICKGKMGVCTARLPKCRWVIIQPGERLNGIQEVTGSIPVISTKSLDDESHRGFFYMYASAILLYDYFLEIAVSYLQASRMWCIIYN